MRVLRVGSLATLGLAVGAAAAAVAVGQSGPDKSVALKASIDISKPKNIILFIGDGMGDSEVTSGRYYAKGASGRLNMDSLPFRGDVTTYNVGPAAASPYPPNYVPDSAPTASAWSSGIKTLDGRVGQGPSSGVTVPGQNYETFMEIAKLRGLSTGNVSTAEITDATPAGPSSHISQRGCQGPNDTRSACPTETKAAGGLGSIAEQQADNQFDVVLGGGRARYLQPLAAGGTTNVIDYAKTKGYKYVANKTELAGVTSLAPGERLLGLFHDSNMTTEYQSLIASDTGAGSATTKCQPSNRGEEPSLAEMTDKAIKLLQGNQKGFVLQVEGASIDKRDHASDACGQIGELVGMDDAIGIAQQFQATHPDTLIVVSADHSHTSQIIGQTTVPRGQYTTLQTIDGSPIRISYGTAAIAGSQSHTGATVPVFASGPRAADVTGTIDQTALFPILTNTQTGNGPAVATPIGGDVGGAVAATLSLTVGAPAAFAAFTPGVARDYTAALNANVVSTAGLATLTIADPSTVATGRLVNGTFALEQPLQAKAKDGAFVPVGGTSAPSTLVTYTGPVSNDNVPVGFKQSIGANEALRTGAYAKTLTLTLSTSTP